METPFCLKIVHSNWDDNIIVHSDWIFVQTELGSYLTSGYGERSKASVITNTLKAGEATLERGDSRVVCGSSSACPLKIPVGLYAACWQAMIAGKPHFCRHFLERKRC